MKVELTIDAGDGRIETYIADEPTTHMAAPLIFKVAHAALVGRQGEIAAIQASLKLIGEFVRLAADRG